MFAITGATGNTGSVIAEKLLAQGKKVRVIGRDATRLARFVQKGAEAFAADITDAATLARAFDGSEAVYAMVPPNSSSSDVRAYQERVSDALASALAKASVSHAVVLSSVGANQSERPQHCIVKAAAEFQVCYAQGNMVQHLTLRLILNAEHLRLCLKPRFQL